MELIESIVVVEWLTKTFMIYDTMYIRVALLFTTLFKSK